MSHPRHPLLVMERVPLGRTARVLVLPGLVLVVGDLVALRRGLQRALRLLAGVVRAHAVVPRRNLALGDLAGGRVEVELFVCHGRLLRVFRGFAVGRERWTFWPTIPADGGW